MFNPFLKQQSPASSDNSKCRKEKVGLFPLAFLFFQKYTACFKTQVTNNVNVQQQDFADTFSFPDPLVTFQMTPTS
jgi:hypothetical protein